MKDFDSISTLSMPDDLAAAIGNLEPIQRKAAVEGWLSAGVGGRQRCSDFVYDGKFDWTRRLRCQLAIRRLIGAGAPWL